jgi:hypothetical protein
MVLLLSLCIVRFAFVCSLNAQAQHSFPSAPEKCKVEKPELNAPEYKVGQIRHTGGNSPAIFLVISVELENFTKDKMIALAKQLKKDYCKETRLWAIIFDDYDAAKHVTFLDITRNLEKAKRGIYHLDFKKEEYIQFSTVRGGPLDEVKIDLRDKQ